jgi:hypothetical protein
MSKHDIYADELHHIEMLQGGMLRFVLAVEQDGETRILDETIVMHIDKLPDAMQKGSVVMASRAMAMARKIFRPWMH